MAKPNYQYEKRQRELEKQKKKAAKANRKAAAAGEDTATNDPSEPAGANADSAAQPD